MFTDRSRLVSARDRFFATFVHGQSDYLPRYEDLRGDLLETWSPEVRDQIGALDRWATMAASDFGLPGASGLGRPMGSLADAAAWFDVQAPLASLKEGHALVTPVPDDAVLGLSLSPGLLLTFSVADGAGLDTFALFMADHGDWLVRMMTWLTQWDVRRLQLASNVCEFDYLHLSEPIASAHGPVIGPAMFERFVVPYYAALTETARSLGIPVVIWESWGQVGPLLPAVVGAGATVLCLRHANEAGLSAIRVRAQLGPAIGLMGGVDARLLGRDEAEMLSHLDTMTPLLAQGRFLPMLDDRPRVGLDPQLFVRYWRLLHRWLADQQAMP